MSDSLYKIRETYVSEIGQQNGGTIKAEGVSAENQRLGFLRERLMVSKKLTS